MRHRRASFALPAGFSIAANHSVASMPSSFVNRFQGLSGWRHVGGMATWRPGENARSCTNPICPVPAKCVDRSGCRQKLSAMEDAPRLLVPILGLMETGGWGGLKARILTNLGSAQYTHLWSGLGSFGNNPMGIHWTGIVLGLGWVISFGYWTTDFLVVQRVLAAKDLRSAKMAPIIGAAFKMMVPFIVILPGLLGLALLDIKLLPEAEALKTHGHSYNEVLPLMLARY